MPSSPTPEARLRATTLPTDVRHALSRYVREITALLASNLEAVVLYGSAARGEFVPDRSNLNLLLILGRVDVDQLRRYGKLHRRWAKEGIVVPLMLLQEEMGRMADVFPLEYSELLEHHLILAGDYRFEPSPLNQEVLLRQCRQEIRGNLIRLRQRFVEGSGSPEAVAILLPLSVTALLAPLRGWLRVSGHGGRGTAERLLEDAETEFQLERSALQDAWRLKQAHITPGPGELPRLFDRYVAALAALAGKIDSLQHSSRK